MSGLPREVIKWIQSLDLTHPLKNVKRDFSNGYLVAEIMSWYHPQDIQMHSYTNGTSISTKLGNWQQLERIFFKHGLCFPQEEIEGTVHCKPGAATSLVTRLYTQLTHRMISAVPPENAPNDFSDSAYQSQLPLYARSTAAQSIKTNLAMSELVVEPDRILCMQKAQAIIYHHSQHRKEDKQTNPDRFGIKAVQAPSRLATSVLQAQGGVREDFEAGDKTDRNLLE